MSLTPQVDSNIYYNSYENLNTFICYYYQNLSVLNTAPKKYLEIGIGNKLVSDHIKKQGINVTTCDHDKKFSPDKVADVRKLPFKNKEFDTVAAFEVLEHLPFEDFNKALNELNRVSKKYVILSLPYRCVEWQAYLNFWFIKRWKFNLSLKIPAFFKKVNINTNDYGHYWEMGAKDYPIKKIRNEIKDKFSICQEFQSKFNNYHYFFILKKK